MKNALALTATIAVVVASAAVAYYYTMVLPQQAAKTQQDVAAIREAIAPTQAQQARQGAAFKATMEQSMKTQEGWVQCEKDMEPKRDAYLNKQCSQGNDVMKEVTCRSTVMQSAAFKQFDCPMSF